MRETLDKVKGGLKNRRRPIHELSCVKPEGTHKIKAFIC